MNVRKIIKLQAVCLYNYTLLNDKKITNWLNSLLLLRPYWTLKL
jgi:hypothetical protein